MSLDSLGWQQAGQLKKEALRASIPAEWRLDTIPSADEQRDVTGPYVQQFLSAKEVEITETDAVGIVQKTSTGIWTSVEIAKAFCHRAALAHQLVNCLVETFFAAAIQSAQELDDYYAANKKPIGPLHGLPISLKDQFHVRGVETSMGYVGWMGTFQGQTGTGKERVFESEMVKELRNLGAVLFCKTSVPQTLMAGETFNHIIGYTWNPKNRKLSCGGSSGGEGALIAMRGSPAGFGTDIGGSIRIPAAFNGLYGIRPSSGRLPYEGMANSMDGQNTILSVVGPLATTVGALKLLFRALLSQEPWFHDPLVHEIPWRSDVEQKVIDAVGSTGRKMAFGVIKTDYVVTPQPPVRRAIDMVVEAVEKLGHEVIEWKPPSHEKLLDVVLKVWDMDGGADIEEARKLSGEPLIPQYAAPSSGREQANATEIAAINREKRELQKEYMEYWNSTKSLTKSGEPVDALICPLAPFPAARPNGYKYYGYSAWVNFVDYTSVTVPVTTVDAAIDKADESFTPLSELDDAVQKLYDPQLYDGAFVSVQLVGRRLQEEKMLVLADAVGGALSSA